jgi:3-oxoacyl-[acyl-carrier-protein] synthase II
MEKIVVTGMGVISAIGENVEATAESIRIGRSGIGALKYIHSDHSDLPCGEVPFSDDEMRHVIGMPNDEIATRTSLMGIIALREALESAHIENRNDRRIAFVNGTTVGGMEKSEQYYMDYLNNDLRNDYIAEHECGACTEKIADSASHLFSYVTTLSTACSSAANAVVLGANLIKAGLMDIAVVGGSECITKFHLNGFNTLMILDKEPCRPFDDTRAGLNLGEGAAYIVLERLSEAKSRGAGIISELAGYANACDAFHQTASSERGIGIQLAMMKSLKMANLKPSDIDYINVHGTGTRNNDLSEGRAIADVFGDKIPSFSSTKAMTGHTTSASGSIEAVISILSIMHGMIPGNLRFSSPMHEMPLTPVKATEKKAIDHVLSNSCGFGGNSTSLLFSKINSEEDLL